MKKNHILILMSIVVIIIIIIISIILISNGNILDNENEDENYLMEYVEDETYITTEEEKSKTMFEILSSILNYSNDKFSIIKEIYKMNLPKVQGYAIYSIQNDEAKYNIIYLDSMNSTYKIENIEQEEFNKIKNNIVNNKYILSDSIDSNGNNSYSVSILTDEDFAISYYDIIRNLINSNEDELYNMLNKEYKEKRFQDNTSFINYCTNMKNLLQNTYVTQYSKELENGKEKYICIDNIGNTFIIKLNSNVDFEIQLDDYTIETDDFKTKYSKTDNKTKAITDVDKVMKMINYKDYQSLYNVLDETYKTNNFATLNDFINYLNNTFYNFNYYSISNTSEQGPYYVVTVLCKENATNASDFKESKMIISLGEDTNFTMSFVLE